MSLDRTQLLHSISEMTLPSGMITYKLDFLGMIRIYNKYYFNVYRRYNNVYEIVFEDFEGDFHYHKDYTVRESLQKILCLSEEQMKEIHTIDAISFKHHANIPENVMGLRWTEIQHRWYALDMNVGGILQNFHNRTYNHSMTSNKSCVSIPDTPIPCRAHVVERIETPDSMAFITNDVEMVAGKSTLVERIILPSSACCMNLSDRFSELMESTNDEEYTVLRNGTRIAKPRVRGD